MQMPEPVQATPKSNTLWWIIGAVVLLCCCLVVIGVVAYGATLQNTFTTIDNSLQSIATSGSAPATAVETLAPAVPAGGAAGGGPANGGLGDPTLKSDVWASIVHYYGGQSCADVTSTTIRVTQPPAPATGVWQEDWSVQACGDASVFHVTFTPSPQGGTDYEIKQ